MIDNITDALFESVKAAGGAKAVAPILWPEKDPLAAQRQLLDCLNEDRPQQLNPGQVVLVMRLARARGCHAGMEFFCSALSYAAPQPVEPKDEADELRRQYIEAARSMAKMAEKIEALERAGLRAVA